eukprot:CAMPEP_0196994798 /NCGR_PEP_ID=MMETSP1380-20130617/1028_1 /TAXON_ID=5936 /ORGANISM="Euplotes crassus, Strain CT5" /LENGTH=294 /DNA_ID=CAMNT_0042410265 /DNA_START=56 /DNA_END=940 /DNA_ORIENTATION=-
MIGVISYPDSPSDVESSSYIQGETAKFVESTGARNVVIEYNQDWTTSSETLEHLNGIIIQNSFNGVFTSDTIFKETLLNAYKYAEAKNEDGIKFPIWASGVTALQLSEVLSTSKDMSEYTVSIDAMDLATSLNFTEHTEASQEGPIKPLYDIIPTMRSKFLEPAVDSDIVYFDQGIGITPASLQKDKFLSEAFQIVATATDRNGNEFVALLKHRKFPVILSFALFEAVYNFYPDTQIPHSSPATRLTVQFSKLFTDFARSNDQTYNSIEKEYSNNLYNRPMTTTVNKEYQTFYF